VEKDMYCKRLQATMTVNACQKRQRKALTYLELEACRECPQKGLVNAGLESDQDILNMIKEIGLECPLGLQLPAGIQAITGDRNLMKPAQMEKTEQKGFYRRRMRTSLPLDHSL
jgi:hypothetical protein